MSKTHLLLYGTSWAYCGKSPERYVLSYISIPASSGEVIRKWRSSEDACKVCRSALYSLNRVRK